ncbi:MAG: Osmosensitive channel His kinase sensor [Frankiales bacterium]|nr:Osmosensitive channel His kinase sensor [Frankiales bacterium]
MGRGSLRVYLGAAPGVGKTYAMLDEAQRRVARGTDVAVGFVETYRRKHTAAMLQGLEVVPRRNLRYRGATFSEMDVDAVLARRPQVALIDELAHTNVPGSRNGKRWQDVEELLDAGIDVISTVNIQHLESLNDVVAKITGVPQRETIPDAVVRAADQVELIDMAAEALRRRLAHGNVYAPEKVDAALANYFRVGNLTALRELALLWTADKVDEGLQHYRAQHDITGTWETRERVVVAITGGPEGETLIRRAARIAARSGGGELLAVHVTRSDGLTGADPAALAHQRQLTESLGGSYHHVVGDEIPEALLEFARAENATQLVLGGSRRSWLSAILTGPGIGATTIRDSGDIDVHIVTHAEMGRGRGIPHLRGNLTRRRQVRGFALAVGLPVALTLGLVHQRTALNLVSDVLLFLLAVVVVALVGGWLPAVVAAVGGSILLNYYFAEPLHTLSIRDANNALALAVFVVVAALVSSVVDLASRRTRQAARATVESTTLATLAGSVLSGDAALPALLERVREAFGLNSVAMLEKTPSGGVVAAEMRGPAAAWTTVAAAGPDPCRRPEEGDIVVPAGDRFSLVLRGKPLRADDQRLVGAFAAQAAGLVDRAHLEAAAASAASLGEADRMRTALLAAVGHDLRSPLASAKAAVTSLRSGDITWSQQDTGDLLATADESLDRLSRLVDNLLDMSRLQAGALSVLPRPVALAEMVALALDDLGPAGRSVVVDVPDDLPEVVADPGLLERVLVNVLSNALRYAPSQTPPRLSGSSLHDRVELRIIDRGPGIPAEARDRVFAPFQRLGDTDNTSGVGLGLALGRGLMEAMGGALSPEETPGGGLTMVISLPTADVALGASEPGQRERAARSGHPVVS